MDEKLIEAIELLKKIYCDGLIDLDAAERIDEVIDLLFGIMENQTRNNA